MSYKYIPPDVKLSLRQEAGFGCCVCGNPLIEYHHIIPREEERHNRPEDMMCLCPNHHGEIRVISKKKQRKIKANPKNRIEGNVSGKLHIDHSKLIAKLGGSIFETQGTLLEVDGESLVALSSSDEGELNVSVRLYDENGKNILTITNNEWRSGDYLAWDIEYGLNILKIRYKKGNIVLEIDARKSPLEIKGSLWYEKQNFLLRPSEMLFNGIVQDLKMTNCVFIGGRISVNTRTGLWLMG